MTEETKHAPISDELKPCPFCGGKPRIVEPHETTRSEEGETDEEEWVSFVECDCVDMFFIKSSKNSQVEARQTVIASWNCRAHPLPLTVRVKPLVWGKTSYDTPEVLTPVGTYRINEANMGGWSVARGGLGAILLRDADGRQNYSTEQSAMVAAQADHDALILSAIELTQ